MVLGQVGAYLLIEAICSSIREVGCERGQVGESVDNPAVQILHDVAFPLPGCRGYYPTSTMEHRGSFGVVVGCHALVGVGYQAETCCCGPLLLPVPI